MVSGVIQSGAHHFLIFYPLRCRAWAHGHYTAEEEWEMQSHFVPGMGERGLEDTQKSLPHCQF